MSDDFVLTNGEITARFDARGAELQSLTDAAGHEYMSAGDPAFWSGRAPLLFPIVGALANDRYRLDGREYAMPKHGFARRSHFRCEEHEPYEWVRFALEDSEETRSNYPFAFRMEVFFRLWGSTLTCTVGVTNRDSRPMPFSFGFHPAFAWPLPGGKAKSDHRLVFEHAEEQAIRRLDTRTGLVLPDPVATPVEGDTLRPEAGLFEPDALIWDRLNSRACTFGAPGGGMVSLEWDNLPMLGVWQKPGAPFLCIEPWQGLADSVGFAGEFAGKPGIVLLAPQDKAQFSLSITVSPPGEIA